MSVSRTRTAGASSAGTSVSTRICSANSVKPKPMAIRPRARVRTLAADAEGDEADDEKHRRGRRYVEREDLHDQCRADVAPSMIASAGTSVPFHLRQARSS